MVWIDIHWDDEPRFPGHCVRVSSRDDPGNYEAWYHTPRGAWIGAIEFSMMMKLLRPEVGDTLLDVGSGTGYFSRRFAASGLRVTGIEPDTAMLQYANRAPGSVMYAEGSAEQPPFADQSFDYVTAVTSLCFVSDPVRALDAMWRVAKRGVILGLLNSASLLYRRKHGQGAYAGARWDAIGEVQRWAHVLSPTPVQLLWRTGIFLPDGSASARLLERLLPSWLPWGGFLAVYLQKPMQSTGVGPNGTWETSVASLSNDKVRT
jgi:SAM-dependent methyltransferase